MSKDRPNRPQSTCLFAWDGVSFQVPDGWHLSSYVLRKNLTRVVLEDDYSVRLEAEWTRPKRPVNLKKTRDRAARAAKPLAAAATHKRELSATGSAHSVVLYTMPDKSTLLTAFLSPPGSTLFCLLRLHSGPEDRDDPAVVLKLIAGSFTVHRGDTVPWAVYDISMELPVDFRLASTSLEAGRKLFVFEWRLRRLYVWHFSLADILLKGRAPEQWAAEFLNAFKGIPGPVFSPGVGGEIEARRPLLHFLGQFEEIGRRCFRYRAQCIHNKETNRITLWVYNYRHPDDLEKLPHGF